MIYFKKRLLDECHLSALVKFVKEVDDWEFLGIHLGVKDAVIKDIKALNHFQPAPSRKDMLVKWLKGGHANRANFIEALKAIDENRIVQEILSQNGKGRIGFSTLIIFKNTFLLIYFLMDLYSYIILTCQNKFD